MSESDQIGTKPINVRRILRVLTSCWTVAMATTLTWELIDERNQALDIALSKAFGAWEREVAIRRWDAASGGIYVTLSENVQPDPYLEQVTDRDVTTPSGRKLTLLGPALIIRNIRKLTRDQFDSQGHLTSLHPIAPEDEPDPWEKKSLEGFEKGQPEAWTVESIGGERICISYVRFSRSGRVCSVTRSRGTR